MSMEVDDVTTGGLGARRGGQEFLGGILLEFLVSSFANVRIAAAAW